MKKLIIFFSILLLTNCSDTGFTNDCFPNYSYSATVNLSLPEFSSKGNNLNVPGGNAKTTLNGRDILIINRGSRYHAFDLICPEGDCNEPMDFDGTFITCSCSGKIYNYLQGGAPQDGDGCFALEYNVLKNSNNTLQISY